MIVVQRSICLVFCLLIALFVIAAARNMSVDDPGGQAKTDTRSDVVPFVENVQSELTDVRETTIARAPQTKTSSGEQTGESKTTKASSSSGAGAQQRTNSSWAEFRGPNRSGISNATGIPLKWSDGENIAWKTPLPGRGASSPIIWGDHVYVTAYSGYGLSEKDPQTDVTRLKRHLLCIDRRNGQVIWQTERSLGRNPSEHPIVQFLELHGYASCTPVADDTGVYVYFGTNGLVAYDHNGRQKWEKQLGIRMHNWGSASSPILFKNFVIIHADIEAQKLVALDKQTGREMWSVPTGERDSWSTPLIVETNGHHELIFHHSIGKPATVMAIDPETGAQRWQCRVLEEYLCPSPIAGNGTIYMIAYQKGAAVRAGGRGDVTNSHVQWEINRGSEVGTPIFYNGHLYWAEENDGIVHCVDAQTGKILSSNRLQPSPGRIYASGVFAEGRLYFVSRENGTYVVDAKPQFQLLAHNKIQSDQNVFNATPALSQGQLFLRSDKYLYCIAAK